MKQYNTLDIINQTTEKNQQGVRITTYNIRSQYTEKETKPKASASHSTLHSPLSTLLKGALLLIILCFGTLNAQFYTSFYSDHKSFSVGDILTVHIAEQSKATSSSQSQTTRKLDQKNVLEAGTGPLSFIPAATLGGSANNSFRGDANTSRDASLTSKMTVRIVDMDTNGNLIIEGSRTVTVNGEDEITTLRGIVRSQDVRANNTVFSYNIADAQISYSGKGTVHEGSRPGLITRFMNFIF